MSHLTINQALSIGQKNLLPITKNYKNEVLWLMQKCLNINSVQLLLNDTTQELSAEEMTTFNQFIERRKNKEPLQHILGTIEFYGYQFNITKDVFIPRPETEIFVDILRAELPIQNKVLEIGAGTGCISIILELENLAEEILSIDNNLKAIKLSQSNAQRLGCTKINFCINDLFYMQHQSKYDLIISNPPYITADEYEKLPKHIKNFEPKIALTDYDDGLLFYRRFANILTDILYPHGVFICELGSQNIISPIKFFFTNAGYNITIYNDLNNHPRFLAIYPSV